MLPRGRILYRKFDGWRLSCPLMDTRQGTRQNKDYHGTRYSLFQYFYVRVRDVYTIQLLAK